MHFVRGGCHQLKLHLGLVLEMIELGRPILVVLNMMDEARRRGIKSIPKIVRTFGRSQWSRLLQSVMQALKTLLSALDQEKYTVPQTELEWF